MIRSAGLMPGSIPSAGLFGGWASTRYGGFGVGGPDALSKYLAMTSAELRQLDCVEYREAIPVIAGGAAQFSEPQRAALIARANECGQNNPLLPDFAEGALESVVLNPLSGLTDAVSSALEGAGVVLGNIVISLGGVALIVAGVGRLFGTNPIRAGARLTPAGRLAGA